MQAKTQPFHETIVDAIRLASTTDLECLATLIKETSIPKNHDEIIAVWKQRSEGIGWGDTDLGVSANLLEKKEASIKSEEKKS